MFVASSLASTTSINLQTLTIQWRIREEMVWVCSVHMGGIWKLSISNPISKWLLLHYLWTTYWIKIPSRQGIPKHREKTIQPVQGSRPIPASGILMWISKTSTPRAYEPIAQGDLNVGEPLYQQQWRPERWVSWRLLDWTKSALSTRMKTHGWRILQQIRLKPRRAWTF